MGIREEEKVLFGILDKRSEEDLKIKRTSDYFYNLSKNKINCANNNDNIKDKQNIINNTFININVQNFY